MMNGWSKLLVSNINILICYVYESRKRKILTRLIFFAMYHCIWKQEKNRKIEVEVLKTKHDNQTIDSYKENHLQFQVKLSWTIRTPTL